MNGWNVRGWVVALCGAVALCAQAEVVKLANACGRAEVDTCGAYVTSYVPAGGREVFFYAKGGTPAAGAWLNRGIPISWPWFDMLTTSTNLPMHGFARTTHWRIVSKADGARESKLVLACESTPATRALWPHDFRLRYEVVCGETLSVALVTENTGREPYELTLGFHPYFAVSRVEDVRLEGLGGELAAVWQGMHRFLDMRDTRFALIDPAWKRRLEVEARGNGDTVVWNIGEDWNAFDDLAAGDAARYICVEPQTLAHPARIAPGGTHTISLRCRVRPLE